MLSVGRVQTPTLKLVVDRDREIARFVSVPFWAVEVTLSHAGQSFIANWTPPQVVPTTPAAACSSRSRSRPRNAALGRRAQVLSVETERVREGPPLPFDLGTLQEVCSKAVGASTCRRRWTSPRRCTKRTRRRPIRAPDSGYLPEHAGRGADRSRQSGQDRSRLRPRSTAWTATQRSRAWNDGKVTAHHGIIPTLEPANLSAMKRQGTGRLPADPRPLPRAVPAPPRVRPDGGAARVRRAVAGGRRQTDRRHGWRQVLAVPEESDGMAMMIPSAARCCRRCVLDCPARSASRSEGAEDPAVQALYAGRAGQNHEGRRQLVTDPRLKQKLKETTGIGTEGDARQHHQRAAGRGYLLKKGRAIRSSDAAFTLIDAVPAAIADPGTTAVWEQALDMIEAGQMTLDTFIAKQSSWSPSSCSSTAARSTSKLPPRRTARSAARRCASAPARAVLSGLAAATRTARARSRSKSRDRQARGSAAYIKSPRQRPRRLTPPNPLCHAGRSDGGANLPHPRDSPARASFFCNGVRVPLGHGLRARRSLLRESRSPRFH